MIHKDAAVCRHLFNSPSDAGGTDSHPSQCLCADKPFDTTPGRFTAPLPLGLALTGGAVSDLGHAPAALSVGLMEGFVSPLALIPVEDLSCSCYYLCFKLCMLCTAMPRGINSNHQPSASPHLSDSRVRNSHCRRSRVSPAKRTRPFCRDVALLLFAVRSKGRNPVQSSLRKSWQLI